MSGIRGGEGGGGVRSTAMATAERSSTRTICLCRICESVREIIKRIFEVLGKYGWLLDAYIVDFYVDNLWEGLPSSWKNFFEYVKPQELGAWIAGDENPRRPWPLSLLALRRVVKILEIKRDQRCDAVLKCENIRRGDKNFQPDQRQRTINDEQKLGNGFSSNKNLRNLLSKHVKPKKIHEIDVMAEIIADCAASANSECVADIGAGMGHLARRLAYEHGMCVICVEQDPLLSDQARKLDEKFETIALKHRASIRAQRPHHVSIKIERDASEFSNIIEELNRNFKTEFRLNGKLSGFGLIGLHPCGDLATTLLQFYAESEYARFICIAGCCYMKLTLNSESYPMSEYLRSSRINELSYAALEVACHAVENHCHKLKSAGYWELKVHAYRAALEALLVSINASLRHSQLKSVKLRETTTFKEYCIAAASDILPPGSLSDAKTPRMTKFLDNWERVVVFGSLRLMLAPLVESIVLLDRFLYLSERDLSPWLKAVFDPFVSPRNFVLTSVK